MWTTVRKRTWLAGAAMVLALGGLAGGSESAAVASDVEARAWPDPYTHWTSRDPCPEVFFLGSRGTDQGDLTADAANRGMGEEVWGLYQNIATRLLDDGIHPAPLHNPYSAVEKHQLPTNAYADAVTEGATNVADYLTVFGALCPNARWILAGFSQGAHVTHRGTRLVVAGQSEVDAVVLLADPARDPWEPGYISISGDPPGGVCEWPNGNPLCTAPDSGSIPEWARGRTISVCWTEGVGDDPVCQWNESLGLELESLFGAYNHTKAYESGGDADHLVNQAATIARSWVTVATAPVAPTIHLDRTSGDQTTHFHGTASGFTPNGFARLQFWGPSNELVWDDWRKPIDSAGGFTFLWYHSQGEPFGQYRVQATDRTTDTPSNEVTFTIEQSSTITPTVSVSPTSGPQGTVFSEPGEGFTPNSTATLHFVTPSGGEATLTKATNSSGSYDHTYASGPHTETGRWEYYAVDDTTGISAPRFPFTITEPDEPPPPPPDPTVNVLPSTGDETTLFDVEGTGFTPNGLVEVVVRDPSGAIDEESTYAASGSGRFSFGWQWAPGDPFGRYRVEATDVASNVDDTDTFTVEPQPAPPGPLTVAPASGPQGTTFRLTGSGFDPSEPMGVQWRNRDGSQLGSGRCVTCVDERGVFGYEFEAGLDINPGIIEYSIRGEESGRTGAVVFTITEADQIAGTLALWVEGYAGDVFPAGVRVELCGDNWVGNTIYEVQLFPPSGAEPIILTDLADEFGSWCVVHDTSAGADDVGQWDVDVRLWPSTINRPLYQQIFAHTRFYIIAEGALSLDLYKTAHNSTPNVGDLVTFTVGIVAGGYQVSDGELTNIVVRDDAPDGLIYVNHAFVSGSGDYDPGTGVITVPSLGWQERAEMDITFRVNDSGVMGNYVELMSVDQRIWNARPGNSSTDEGDDDLETITVAPAADLTLSKWADRDSAIVGDSLTYTIDVRNAGPDAATNIAVQDLLPIQVQHLADTGGGTYDPTTGVWQVGSLPVGSRAQLKITARATAAGEVTNIASVASSDLPDPDSTPGSGSLAEDDSDDSVVTVGPPPNQIPVADGKSTSTPEDVPVVVDLTGSDSDGDALTFGIVTGPSHGSVSASTAVSPTSAKVTYTPDPDYNGAESFVFEVDDGNGGTDTATVTINVAPVNDPPAFVKGPDVSVAEDAGAQTVAGWATGITAGPPDEAGQVLGFAVTANTDPAIFAAGPALGASGTLTFTAAPNAHGTATITVVLSDDGGTANGGTDSSPPQRFTITVTPVNDPDDATVDESTTAPVPAPSPPDTVGLVDPTQGRWHLRDEVGNITSFFFGNPGDTPVMGDWDCDGLDTPGLFRITDAFAYLSNANRSQIADVRFFFGNPSDVPLAGDWNGDGCDTLSIYRPDEQRFYIMNALGENEGGLGAADFSFGFGNPGDKPVVGDWDGDGTDEVGLHRESTGFFYWRNTLDTGIADGEIFFGDPGDRFVAGDWGQIDAVDSPAVFRPSARTFYLRHTLTQGNADASIPFGEVPWLPVAGNFGL